MRTFLWFLLLPCVLGFTSVEAFPDPRIDVKIKYYEVEWNTQWAMKGMSCSIISVTTRVFIIFTLPKWANYKDVSRKEREKWDRFFKQLVDHENGHKDIAVGSVKEIEKVVMNMESRKDCNILKHDSNHLGQKIIEQYYELASSMI